MNAVPFLTLSLVVLLPYAWTTEPNGELRMSIVRWAENKGKDVNRVVQQLDNSEINLEPNKPYTINWRNEPLTRDASSKVIYRENITEPGTYSLNVTKTLSTTWSWARQHNMDYVLNVSQPVSIKVPDDYLVRVESLQKDFWEFKTPMSWNDAEATCRAAGLKLAQPKSRMEVEELQKVLHKKIHNRESGCPAGKWKKMNGYCLIIAERFVQTADAAKVCETMKSMLPFPALGDVAAWQEAVVYAITGDRTPTTHAGARKQLDGQWQWGGDGSSVQDDAWTPGKPTGKGDCTVLYPKTGKLIDKGCLNSWQTLCQGPSSNHWLGALGSDNSKCVEWINGTCIEEEDHEIETHIEDLWQPGKPGDLISSDYALLLQVENEKPLTLMKTSEKRPFLCEPACPLGFINRGPQCLLVNKVWLTWHEAQAACVKMGLRLYETEEESLVAEFLKSYGLQGFAETYWIGGSERRFTGKEVDMTNIEKLQFICELPHGTRKMNVTNQLSYSDEEKEFKLPKVVTPSKNCIVTVKERTITETNPFSVQMDITGWIWLEYSNPTDEHGGNQCDNNNDWVSGEECWAHSKWGYSTSYLQDGDQIMAQGDNAVLTLHGTVTYTYNEHETSITECMSTTNRKRRSVSGRRSKRSIESSEKSLKNLKAKAKSRDVEDNNKPLMSYIGKRAAEWVRAQAQERKAHLVAYTIDQLNPTVTDMKLEKEMSELLSPGSIFEEEFENTGSEPVITTFSKTKAVSNSYRWSVNKGLSIEDSHISSYSTTNTQSASNTFSLSNNIALTDGTSQAISQGTTDSQKSSVDTSHGEVIGSTSTDSIAQTQTSSKGGESSVSATQSESLGKTDTTSDTNIQGTNTVGSKTAKVSDTSSTSTSDTSSTSQGSTESNTKTNKKTETTGSSNSNTRRKSNTKTDKESNSKRTESEASNSGSAGYNFLFVSAKVSFSATARTATESKKTSESSVTDSSEDTATNTQSTASETGQTTGMSNTSTQSKGRTKTAGVATVTSNEESQSHETSQERQSTASQAQTAVSTVGKTAVDTQNYGSTDAINKESSMATSRAREMRTNYGSTSGRDSTYGMENRINQERSKSFESSHGGDVARGLQASQEAKSSHTQQVNIDRNEGVESSEEETLDTQNEVTIPPKTNVKIEWRVEQRKVRLPWKASIHMTGWINVRFNKSDDVVCDIYHDSQRNEYTNTRWTYNYTSSCGKDNRLYGYPLSYLKDKNFIQQGNGLRFVASGVFEAVVATSHYLRVTETALETDYDYAEEDKDEEDDYDNNNQDYYDDEPQPLVSRRRKRELRRLPSKVTDYHLDFDGHGNGRSNIGRNNRHFRKFHATKKFKRIY